MSRIIINDFELGDKHFYEQLGRFIETIENIGNDVLEIITSELPINVINLIKKIHLSNSNKTLKIVYRKENKTNE